MGRAAGRQRIVAAAATLFLEQGFQASSTQQIADLAGVAKSLLHYHFDGKAAILDAVVAPFLDASQAALADLGPAPDATDVLGQHVDLLLAHREGVQLLNLDVSAREAGELGARYDELQERWRELLCGDPVLASAALGAVTRPFVHADVDDLAARRDDLVAAAAAVLGTA